jgi:predicted DNA-binding transcriptional regulator AlpA
MKSSLPDTGFVRLPVVLQHIPVARSTWWEGVRTGRFPTPVKIGGVTAWRVEHIHALIARLAQGETPSLRSDGEVA